MDGSSSQRVFQQKRRPLEKNQGDVNEDEECRDEEFNGEDEENANEHEDQDDVETEMGENGQNQEEVEERNEENRNRAEVNFASVFNVSCVPLELISGDKIIEGKMIVHRPSDFAGRYNLNS